MAERLLKVLYVLHMKLLVNKSLLNKLTLRSGLLDETFESKQRLDLRV